MNFFIKAIEYYLPQKKLTNSFLNEKCGIDIEFLEKKIGIKERRIAAVDEYSSDLAVKAAEKLFNNESIAKDDLDLLLICTQNPDYRIPGIAGIVQDRLGLKKTCFAFDINLGCSGFVYSLIIAGNFIKTSIINKALIIMADEYSKTINIMDRSTASIFGDAAAAAILEPCSGEYGYIDGEFGTDGKGARSLFLPGSSIAQNPENEQFLFMDGRAIFKFVVRTIPPTVSAVLSRNNLDISSVKYFIFHQANKYILLELKRRLKLSDEQLIIDMEKYGNTVSASIPIALKNLILNHKVQKGDWIVLCGFGVGLSWGTILYRHQ